MTKKSKKILAITSMYANPIHPGHIECLELSKKISDELWVIINNDYQAELKRGMKSFQDEKSRAKIVWSLKPVDKTFISIDKDLTVCKTLEFLIKKAKDSWEYRKIIFTKWWDRFAHEIPERKICEKYWVEIVDGLWKKIFSSSELIKNVANKNDLPEIKKILDQLPEKYKEKRYLEIWRRPWWIYYVIEVWEWYKVKKIVVMPWQKLSLQSHDHRSEHWIVVWWIAKVDIRSPKFDKIEQVKILKKNESCSIPPKYIHRLSNIWDEPLVVIEVQLWDYLWEDDIKRYDDDYGRV